ncbi:rhomboid family intramembrane serine protease [Reinekea forsetii]|nr:rhomboid family intramembrane serine protease [Reinekea forsetii]
MNYFVPRQGYIATPIILILNCAIFLALVVVSRSLDAFHPITLLKFGANYSKLVEAGQVWRLVSSIFLHLGLMHLLFNSVSLVILGRFIEPLVGSGLFIAIYLLTGIAGSTASYFFNQGVLSAGASGAIFGLFGVFIAVLLGKLIQPELSKVWGKNIAMILGINLLMGLFLPVDNAAHIGGLVSGIALGYASLPVIKKRLLRHLLK